MIPLFYNNTTRLISFRALFYNNTARLVSYGALFPKVDAKLIIISPVLYNKTALLQHISAI